MTTLPSGAEAGRAGPPDPRASLHAQLVLAREGLETAFVGEGEPEGGGPEASVAQRADQARALGRLARQTWLHQLADLGYLEHGQAEHEERRENREFVLAAERAFLGELSAWPQGSVILPLQARHGAGFDPDPGLLDFLESLTSLDGELPLYELPATGTRDLRSRVVHYRLRQLQLYPLPVGSPMGDDTMAALRQLAVFIHGPQVLNEGQWLEKTLPLMGDVGALLRRLTHTLARDPEAPERPVAFGETGRPLVHDIVVVRDEELARLARESIAQAVHSFGADEGLSHLQPETDRFKRLVIYRGVFYENDAVSGFFRSVFSGVSLDLHRRTNQAQYAARPVSIFAVAWLQLALSQLGYYEGLRVWGWTEETREALTAALAQNRIALAEAVRDVGGGYVALNLPLIIERLWGNGQRSTASVQAQAQALAEMDVDAAADVAPGQDAGIGLWTRLRNLFRRVWDRGRSLVTGFKHLAGKLLEWVKRGVGWLRAQLVEVGRVAADVFLFMARGVRDAVNALDRAISPFYHFMVRDWIVTRSDEVETPREAQDRRRERFWQRVASDLGQEAATTASVPAETHAGQPALATRFDVDRDVRHAIFAAATAAQIQAHNRLIRRMARVLNILAVFVGRAARLVIDISAGFTGWIRLGFRLAGIVRDVIAYLTVRSGRVAA